jgi:dihydropteroate synthase
MHTPTNWPGYGVSFSRPLIMGIVNVTPDSFSDGGRFLSPDQAIEQALRLEEQGADIIDVGGESSRPGSDPVSQEEELNRVIPVIRGFRKKTDTIISIDTYKAAVADQALREGANWINDISGLCFDPAMVEIAQKWGCPVVVMHMQGKPKTMQQNPSYLDVISELLDFFHERIEYLYKRGIKKLILDPGIGFGKRLEDNLNILRHLEQFKVFALPVLIGTSRKSFIGAITGQPIEKRLAGSLTSQLWSVLHGVQIIRTHDVAATKDSIEIINAISQNVNTK